MASYSDNWKTQIRKGYLELCILLMIKRETKVYGFDLLEKLANAKLDVKEGTLYPLLNRMSADGMLAAHWDTENVKGHPRKFYSLTAEGQRFLDEMGNEFAAMVEIFEGLQTAQKNSQKNNRGDNQDVEHE